MASLSATSRNGVARGAHSAQRPAPATLPRSRMSLVARASAAEPARRDVLKAVAGGMAAVSLGAFAPAPVSAASGAAATIQEAYGAFGQFAATGEYSPLESYFGDGVKWVSTVNGGYTGKGKADVARFFTWVRQVNDVSKFQPVKFVEQGNSVAVLVNMAGKGKLTGKPYDGYISHFFVVENGKITDFLEVAGADVSNAVGTTPFPKA
eukprot:XP_001701350.1 ketoacid isomerase-like protein [Chlamydomonas reinhardtii]